METYSTWGMIAEVAGWITIWWILSYFWIWSEALIILTVFLWLDVLFWLLESYIITKNTSSTKLVQWLARKLTRRALPFILIAALRGVWYEDINTMATMVMTILIISEAYSVIWHIYNINQPWSEPLPEIDALSALLKWISDFFAKIINSNKPLDKKDDEQTWKSI